jgi:hypothetical protein
MMDVYQNIEFLFVKGLMGIGRPLLLLKKTFTRTNNSFFACTKIISAVMLERDCRSLMLGLIAV